MRKKMTKEVTKTTVKLAKMEVGEDGLPQAIPLNDEILLGNVSQEKAQRAMNKKFDETVTVFGVQANTDVYEMDVDKFIEIATIKQDTEESTPTEEPKAE